MGRVKVEMQVWTTVSHVEPRWHAITQPTGRLTIPFEFRVPGFKFIGRRFTTALPWIRSIVVLCFGLIKAFEGEGLYRNLTVNNLCTVSSHIVENPLFTSGGMATR